VCAPKAHFTHILGSTQTDDPAVSPALEIYGGKAPGLGREMPRLLSRIWWACKNHQKFDDGHQNTEKFSSSAEIRPSQDSIIPHSVK
jgi:hypothetical protein